MNPLIFEMGDNTDRAFIKEKGIAAAEGLMEILTQKHFWYFSVVVCLKKDSSAGNIDLPPEA